MTEPSIIVDPRYDSPDAVHTRIALDDRDGIEDMVRRSRDTLVVWGDDRMVGEVVDVAVALSAKVTIAPMPLGPYRSIWRSTGLSGKPNRALSAVRRGKAKSRPVATLRVVDTKNPRAVHGFSFGAGIIFRLFEAHQLAGEGRESLSIRAPQLFRELSQRGPRFLATVEGAICADWGVPRDDFSYLVASTLSQSWFSMPTGPESRLGFRSGTRPADMLRDLSRVGRVIDRMRDGVVVADRIHIDADTGYVIDGQAVEPGGSRVIELTTGPKVRLIQA